jgi:hypothetical protein
VEVGWVCDDAEPSVCHNPCAGPFTALASGTSVVVDLTDAPAGAFEGSCAGRGPEAIYTLDVPAGADVTITTDLPGTTADSVIYVRSDCADPESEVDCNDDGEEIGPSLLELTDLAADTYYVFVDTYGLGGPVEVMATVTP